MPYNMPYNNSFDVTLLWENEEPNQIFKVQTIDVDYSSYDYIWVATLFNTQSSSTFDSPELSFHMLSTTSNLGSPCIVTSNGKLNKRYSSAGNYFDYLNYRCLTMNSSKNQISFTTGISIPFNHDTVTTWSSATTSSRAGNNYCIPLKIYGITKSDSGNLVSLMDYVSSPVGNTNSYTIENYPYCVISVCGDNSQSPTWVTCNDSTTTKKTIFFNSNNGNPDSICCSANQEYILKNGGSAKPIVCWGTGDGTDDSLFGNTDVLYSGTTITKANKVQNWIARNTTAIKHTSTTVDSSSPLGIRQIWGLSSPLWG